MAMVMAMVMATVMATVMETKAIVITESIKA